MRKLKPKDYLQEMSHPKIYNIEVLDGDMIYEGKEITAESEEQALRILEIMTGGQITPFSEIIKLEVHSIQ
jgi:hypothetical protein